MPALHISTSKRSGSRAKNFLVSSCTDARELMSALRKMSRVLGAVLFKRSMRALPACSLRPVKYMVFALRFDRVNIVSEPRPAVPVEK